MVFVNDYANAEASAIFKAAHDSPAAIYLHVLPRADSFGGQHYREVDN